jgi:hypothetical protein
MSWRRWIASGPLAVLVACGVSEAPRATPEAPSDAGAPQADGPTTPPAADGARGDASVASDLVVPDVPAAFPDAGAQISINGVPVPKEKAIVFLHIGHSNMAGRTTTPEELRPFSFETHPRLWRYGKGGVWTLAKEPLSADSMTGTCGGVGCAGLPFGAGPGMSILRTALAVAPPDAYVISIGRGQSGTTGGYCRSFRKGGLLYDFVMEPAKELKGKVTFAGVWTMLGLSEDNDGPNNDRFGDCMVAVANDMRSDLGEPDMPFLMGDWEAGAVGDLAPTSSVGQVVVPQLRALPGRIPRSLVIPTEGLPINPLDGHHYDLTGHKLWAERGLSLLAMKGWMPWAVR